MQSFYAMIWERVNSQSEAQARSVQSGLPRAAGAYREDGLLILDLTHDMAGRNILPVTRSDGVQSGAVFGTLFRTSAPRSGARRVSRFDNAENDRLIRTSGRSLFSDFWGSYVAFFRSADGVSIIADPSASMPCYYTDIAGVTHAFSHLEKCDFIDRKQFSVNEAFVARLLVYDKIQSGETGLTEIGELTGGERLCISGRTRRRDRIWDPRTFAQRPLDTPAKDAAAQLGETCKNVVRAWGECFDAVSVSLSGGLDSAIVLACLAGESMPRRIFAFHNLLQSGDAPELHFARDAAQRAGVPLEIIRSHPPERLPDTGSHPASVRPFRSFLAAPMPSPFGAGCGAKGSQAIFTGQGGDHLFLARRTPLGLADHIHRRGLAGLSVAELLNASRLSNVSVWKTATATVRNLSGKRTSAVEAAVRNRQARLEGWSLHGLDMRGSYPGWAIDGSGIAPLKFLQVSSLAHLQQVRNRLEKTLPCQVIDPLISQPLIELCLRTPCEILCAGGISRGLARQAFAGSIPESIRLRMGKGSASAYFADFLNINWRHLVEALAQGELARRGLLSPGDCRALLDPENSRVRELGRTLLIWYAVEAWLRTWKVV